VNRVNPLHIIVLLSVFILFLFFQISALHRDIKEEKRALYETQKVATELLSLKRIYGDKQHLKKALQRILTQPSFKKSKIEAKYDKHGVSIVAKMLSLSLLNSLMSKIYSAPFTIEKLTIKRVDSEHADLKLEIVW
jgi:hypothetical protein